MKYAIALLLVSSAALGDPPAMLPMKAYLEDDVDDTSTKAVIDVIDKANEIGNRVILEINSGGGEIDSGFKLVKAIERAKKPVTCIVDGSAQSMASYIFESCAKRVMTKRSLLMIHEAITASFAGQTWAVMDSALEIQAETLAMFAFYSYRIPGLTVESIAAKTSGGRRIYLGWQEAKKLGAVDLVVNSVSEVK